MTSIKDAIKLYMDSEEHKNLLSKGGINGDGHKVGATVDECEVVRLCPIAEQANPITKMDKDLGMLKSCKHLRLSTNSIDKIANLSMLPNLTVLSMGRNQLKSLAGVADVSETLVQLWVSYNKIASLSEVAKLPKLEVLFMSNNLVSSMGEVDRLSALPKLRDVNLINNPVSTGEENWRLQILKRLPALKIIDGALVEDEERENASSLA